MSDSVRFLSLLVDGCCDLLLKCAGFYCFVDTDYIGHIIIIIIINVINSISSSNTLIIMNFSNALFSPTTIASTTLNT